MFGVGVNGGAFIIRMAVKMFSNWFQGTLTNLPSFTQVPLKREVRVFGLEVSLFCCWAAIRMAEETRQHFSLVPAAL